MGFQPFIRGYASYAFAFYATYHEACRWARENGHRSRPSGPFKLMCDHDIKVLRDRIRATSEVGPVKSQLHTDHVLRKSPISHLPNLKETIHRSRKKIFE